MNKLIILTVFISSIYNNLVVTASPDCDNNDSNSSSNSRWCRINNLNCESKDIQEHSNQYGFINRYITDVLTKLPDGILKNLDKIEKFQNILPDSLRNLPDINQRISGVICRLRNDDISTIHTTLGETSIDIRTDNLASTTVETTNINTNTNTYTAQQNISETTLQGDTTKSITFADSTTVIEFDDNSPTIATEQESVTTDSRTVTQDNTVVTISSEDKTSAIEFETEDHEPIIETTTTNPNENEIFSSTITTQDSNILKYPESEKQQEQHSDTTNQDSQSDNVMNGDSLVGAVIGGVIAAVGAAILTAIYYRGRSKKIISLEIDNCNNPTYDSNNSSQTTTINRHFYEDVNPENLSEQNSNNYETPVPLYNSVKKHRRSGSDYIYNNIQELGTESVFYEEPLYDLAKNNNNDEPTYDYASNTEPITTARRTSKRLKRRLEATNDLVSAESGDNNPQTT